VKYRYTLNIDKERCKGCGICISLCPRDVLEFEEYLNEGGNHPVRLTGNECIGCRACVIMCPDIAIELIREDINENTYAR